MKTIKELGRRDALKLGGAAGLSLLGMQVPSVTLSLAAEGGKPLTVNVVNTHGNLTLVLQEMLREKGYLKEFGLKAEILNVADGSKVIGALINGEVDVCMISGFSSLLPAIEKGAKLKVLCGAGTLVGQCIFSKRPEIRRMKDLVGKTVGIGAVGALLHEITVAMLRKHGVDEKKVNFISIGSSTAVFKALVSGTIDAGSSEIDNYPSQAKYGVHALSDGLAWEQLPNYTWQASYTSDRAIAEKRETLVRTLAAFGKLYRFLTGPDSFDSYVHARSVALSGPKSHNMDEAKFFWNFVQKYKGYATDLVITKEQVDYVQKLNLSLGSQKKMLAYEQVTDVSIAKDALKLLS